jgi:putative transposase
MVIGRLPGERSCLSLVWAVLDRASRGWRGVDMNPADAGLLQQLRADLFRPQLPSESTNDPAEPVPTVA